MNKIVKPSIIKYLGLDQQSNEIQSIFTRFILMVMLENIVKGITSSFFILYIIDDQGFEKASIITSILLIVKLLTDYPSGSLSDYIGQSKVLAISYVFYSIAISILVLANDFFAFVVVAVFLGLADAQSSGTIFSWLDNNYKKLAVISDPENRIYAFAKTRSRTLYRIVLGLAVIIGGSLSTNFSRVFVFKIEASLALFAIFLSLIFLRNSKNFDVKSTNESYMDHLRGGISFIFSSKKKFIFIIGTSIYDAGWMIWISIVLFPFYFGYTGSDQASTLLRSTIFFSGTIVVLLASKLSKSYKKEQLAVAQFIHILIMLGGIAILMLIIPVQRELNLMASVAILILFNISNIISVVVNSLESRLYVDLIPSEYRNSVYSLIPTLTAFFAISVLPLTGKLIQQEGLLSGLWVVIALGMIGTLMLHWSIYLLDQGEIKVEQALIATTTTG
ncbi:MAG: MFS transporter [Candidatus Heimdallarchaeota archaeon]|nr:MFS transporter [Candidatus Heimdallarchaeota archaeon]